MARNSGKSHRTFPAKKSTQPSQAEKSRLRQSKHEGFDEPEPQRNYTFKEVQPLNFVQGEYLDAIENNDVIFGIGSAGTGKTFIAANYAARELYYKRVDKVILTRPNIETGRGLGFLPGTLEEKYAPYLLPFDAIFTRALGKGFYEYCLRSKDIEPTPLGFLRGTTFDDCVVLVDEAQNCTREEMKMLLSRIGKNCKMIFSGDTEQSDIHDSGLEDAVDRLENIPGIEVVEFLDEDIVRSAMCKKIIMAYRN
jgi:phosphate starvation-inducible protein PhoH and related proteins